MKTITDKAISDFAFAINGCQHVNKFVMHGQRPMMLMDVKAVRRLDGFYDVTYRYDSILSQMFADEFQHRIYGVTSLQEIYSDTNRSQIWLFLIVAAVLMFTIFTLIF